MTNADDTAFPIVHPDGKGVQYYGLGKRELFAAMAMQGMLSNSSYVAAASRVAEEEGITGVESISRAARQHADGLLAELAK